VERTLQGRLSQVLQERKAVAERTARPGPLSGQEELGMKAAARQLGKQVLTNSAVSLNSAVLGFEAFVVEHGIYR
jgi:hypothetical protein